MRRMLNSFLFLLAFAIGLSLNSNALQADIVTLLPMDIHGGDTSTSTFTDGSITANSMIGDSAGGSFNALEARFGMDSVGNANAFNDGDNDPSNNNDERLGLSFSTTAGLTQLTWDFSRADGANSGLFISGFASDPGATFAGTATGYTSVFDAMTGTLSFELPVGSAFVGDDGVLNLSNAVASAGQSLEIRVIDTDQAGAQLAITSISYDNAVPEPTAALGIVACCVFGLSRRKR